MREYYQRNKEKKRAYQREYNQSHKEKQREYGRKYYEKMTPEQRKKCVADARIWRNSLPADRREAMRKKRNERERKKRDESRRRALMLNSFDNADIPLSSVRQFVRKLKKPKEKKYIE